jgi:hypothetical protein
MNYFWRFNRGWIAQYQLDSPFPYAVAYSPVHMHKVADPFPLSLQSPVLHNRVVVKLSPTAFLLVDYAEPACAQVIRFHVPLTDITQKGNTVTARYKTCTLHLVALSESLQPTVAEVCQPATPALATREITFTQNTAPLSLTLIAAGPVDAQPPVVSRMDGAYTISTGESVLTIDISADTILKITNKRNGEDQVISIGNFVQ